MAGRRRKLPDAVRKLVRPPRRLGEGQDGVLYAAIDDSGEAEVRLWTAGSAEESEEIRRFEAAAARIDWGVPGVHEVRWEPVPRTNPRVSRPQGPKDGGPEDEVYDRIELRVGDDSVPLPTAKALAEFERTEGFALPESYRRFVLRFGPGTLEYADETTVASPGYPKTLKWFDLAQLNRWHRRALLDWPDDELRSMYGADPDQVRRLVLFASTCGGSRYGWDPQDVTDADRHEYGIYHQPRLAPPAMKRVAKTFAEFVAKKCLTGRKPPMYSAHHDHFIRQYDIAQAFLGETNWPLQPDQDVADFAHGLGSQMHCSPRSKLSQTFKKWAKARGINIYDW